MPKISNEARGRYTEKVKEYRSAIEHILETEKKELVEVHGDAEKEPLVKLELSNAVLNLVSYYILLNGLSTSLLGVRSESFLNNARKACYKSIIYLEDVVSPLIDAPFSDYEEKLSRIQSYPEEKRYHLLRKLGFTIQSIVESFGENSKWKWSFVELEGRYAAVAKNLLDLKNLLTGMDPRAEGYTERVSHLNLAKAQLQKAADGYRQKYELSTLRIDDFRMAISFLAGLRRLHIVIGDSAASEELRRKIEIWKTKMDADLKRSEQQGGKTPPAH